MSAVRNISISKIRLRTICFGLTAFANSGGNRIDKIMFSMSLSLTCPQNALPMSCQGLMVLMNQPFFGLLIKTRMKTQFIIIKGPKISHLSRIFQTVTSLDDGRTHNIMTIFARITWRAPHEQNTTTEICSKVLKSYRGFKNVA